ncbi:ferric reductase like transmembrane component-domain-containing protein [Chaetomium sp. MPI-CAGE-AT-0009]|nr:ferric reductase like transmembrane component-domain-containing protein [Chaetomium sp. MPI-CAGE-AT-0009]
MEGTQVCLQMQGALRNTLPVFLRVLCPTAPKAASEDDDLDWMNDPEKVEYIRQLLESLFESRYIVNCYNVAVGIAILVFAAWHWHETTSDNRKWRMLRQQSGIGKANGTTSPSAASSSSSRVAGTAIPVPDAKDIDIERVPLLARGSASRKPRKGNQISRAVKSWLAYQPPPIPVINRTLPSNETSLFIFTWLALNVFFHFYRLPMRWDFFFIFADRTGCVFVVNLPLLYLLSAKNQPLRRLTGYSYEALNIFHRRVGELLCFEAVVHFVSMLLWQFLLAREWLIASRSAYAYFTHPIILCGIGALISYEILYFTSLGSFRQRWYELFLASHVALQLAALAFLWFHYETSQPYVAASLLIFAADRLIWRLALKRTDLDADLHILDTDTLTLSANWAIPQQPPARHPWPHRWLHQSILHGWQPTDHVFLTIPGLAGKPSHTLQAHPFTIASAAPTPPDTPQNTPTKPPHAWFTLLIRAHTGFTRDLLNHALSESHQDGPYHEASRVTVRLDGPYGSPHALGMLRASGCAVLVAGGSGIAVAFPLVWALLHEGEGGDGDGGGASEVSGRGRRRVHLLWVTHSREHRDWVPSQQLEALVERGLELVVPEPTAEAGRPDVTGLVAGWIGAAAGDREEVGVVVSGPDGLNRAVRNVCAGEIGRGREVRVAVEKFGW